jgi:hypothetical protein
MECGEVPPRADDNPFKAQWLLYLPSTLRLKNSPLLCEVYLCVFHMTVKTSSDHFPIRH